MREFTFLDRMDEICKKGSVYGIDTMRNLLSYLGHPEEELKIVHTAGTNGKGSTLAFLAGILTESGCHVGRYISPTIQCYEERFQIDGCFVDREDLERYGNLVMDTALQMKEDGLEVPTAFEAETAIAMLNFKEKAVDYALVECGMGGLLDATNAIEHTALSIITSISEDHKAILGDSVEKIAAQKAGIIKPGTPVVLAVNPYEVRRVVMNAANEQGCICEEILKNDYNIIEETPTGTTFACGEAVYEIKLAGAHQVENAMTAIFASRILSSLYEEDRITEESVKRGLRNTRWPGRLELLEENPPFYLDGAHNPDGARKLADFLEKHFTNKKIVYIMGVLGDKEYDIMLSYLMPLGAAAYVFAPKNARGLVAESLAKAMEAYQMPVTVCDGVAQAVKMAKQEQQDADCFVLCGSLSFIEEYRKSLQD